MLPFHFFFVNNYTIYYRDRESSLLVFIVEEERTWDLSVLMEDTSIEGVKQSADSSLIELKEVVGKLKEKSEEIDAIQMQYLIHEFERVLQRVCSIMTYSYCKYVSNTEAEGSQTLASIFYRCDNETESLRRSLQHILGEFVEVRPYLLDTPELKEYRHLIHKSSQIRPYVLPEVEEEIILEKDNNGISALAQLRESWVGAQVIDTKIEGEKKTISMNRAASLLLSEKQETRKRMSKAYFGTFAKDKLLHSIALRAICANHVNMTRRRKLPSYMTQSLIDQDVDEETITTLLKTLETESVCVQRYIKMKARHLGQKRLLGYDLRAPWSSKILWEKDWSGVKISVIKAYDAFDSRVGTVVRSLFTSRRIDSEDRPGRRNVGGFCASDFERKTSFVFVTHTGTLNNAYSLAHELGHAVHNYFMHKHLNVLNSFRVSACMAETGSIFGELIFSEQLMKECGDFELRIEILANLLERFHQKVFHIGLWAFFEQSVYDAIEAGDALDADRICDIWRATRHRIYGDTIEWTENLDFEWARMPTLFYPNFRFYNYSYSFAQLLVFALYEDYKQNSSDFKERFKRLLSRGSSMSPREQIAEMGYDITRPDFWTLGINRAESFLDELQKLL